MMFAPDQFGCPSFRRDHAVKYAYVAGAMYKGIASKELVVRMGQARLLAFLGTGGLRLERIDEDIAFIQGRLPEGASYGLNLLCQPLDPGPEEALVDLLLARRVPRVEAAAYTQVSSALVRYRLNGLRRGADGRTEIAHRVLAKVSRPEVAERFLSPPPEALMTPLLAAGRVTTEQVELARRVPMADDIVVEADSGGHTDQGVAFALLPAILRQRDHAMRNWGYAQRVRVGGAGGLGVPEAVASMFIMGADFVLTGSVNQCTVEAGISDAAKDLLQEAGVQDTAIAPAGDMFEQGAKVRVLRKASLFPARANKLYDLYRFHNAWEDIDPKARQQLESQVFKRSLQQVWVETEAYLARTNPAALDRAARDAKYRMALIFKWYFVHSARLARSGSVEQRADYQIHCGPALGAFNQWVKGSEREDWRARHVDDIAQMLMEQAAQVMARRTSAMLNNDRQAASRGENGGR